MSAWRSLAVAGMALAAAASLAEAQPLEAQSGETPARTTQPPEPEPLQLQTVLAASATHFPRILESFAEREAAEGRYLSAQGAFDLVLASEGRARASGFWSGRYINNTVVKPLGPFGGQVFGSYRLADGRFPIYEDEFFTNSLGEFKIGVVLSLLRDRDIDSRRFSRYDATLNLQNADFELLLAQIGVQHQATIAYHNWVFAGLQLQVYQDLLAISLERQKLLADQVAQGQRAAIVLTENQQNVLRREILVAEAERTLAAAANTLSLYLRAPSGAPTPPDPNQRPTRPPETREDLVAAAIAESQNALALRPDLGILRTEIARADAAVALGRNDLKPKVDFKYEIARDLGAIQEGGPSRDGLDNIVGFTVSTPLERRFARGRIQEAQAKRRSIEFRLQRTGEQIGAEIENVRIDLVATDRLARLAEQEVQQAQAMQSAEARLFDGGASDFFRLNLREELTADARIRSLQAQLRRQLALANLAAATVNLDQLGLS